jgi:hypothetical protein
VHIFDAGTFMGGYALVGGPSAGGRHRQGDQLKGGEIAICFLGKCHQPRRFHES